MNKAKLLARQDPPVFIKGEEAYITTVTIAKHLEKEHKDVLRAVDNSHASTEFSRRNFAPSEYADQRGKTRRMFILTEQGFIRVVMKLTGPKVAPFQDYVSEEFVRMRDEIRRLQRQQVSTTWQLARTEGKEMRKSVCETMKAFLEYAKASGSEGAKFYYINISKASKKNLFLKDEDPGNMPFRDRLTEDQLARVRVLEERIEEMLLDLMAQGKPYKEIYQRIKTMCEDFGRIVGKTLPGQDARALRAARRSALPIPRAA